MADEDLLSMNDRNEMREGRRGLYVLGKITAEKGFL